MPARPDGVGMAKLTPFPASLSSFCFVGAACVACSGPEPPNVAPDAELIPPGSFGVAGAVGLGSRATTGSLAGTNPVALAGLGGAGGEGPEGLGGAGGDTPSAAPPNLVFSEYLEGSSSNKALELLNRGKSPLELSACTVELYTNGAATSARRIALSEQALEPGSVWVLCHPSSHARILAVCNQSSGSMSYNGNDALVLVCDGVVQDSFGQVGFDPGTAWAGATTRTADATLRRRCSVASGDKTPDDSFDPDAEWVNYGLDVFDYLGDPECAADEPSAGAGGASSAGGAGGAAGHAADCGG